MIRNILAFCAFVVVLTGFTSGALAQKKKTLAVLPLTGVGVDSRITVLLTDLLTVRVSELGTYDVLATDEINAMIGMEKVKEVAGCDNVACAAQIAGMLGVDEMVTGNVGRLGDNLNLKLTLFDAAAMKVLRRSLKTVRNDENLFEGVVLEALSELFATNRWQQKIAELKAAAATSAQGAAANIASVPADRTIRSTTSLDEIGICQKGDNWWFCQGKEQLTEGQFANRYGLRLGAPNPIEKYDQFPGMVFALGTVFGLLGGVMGVVGILTNGTVMTISGFLICTGGIGAAGAAVTTGRHGFDPTNHEMSIDEARMYSELYNKAKGPPSSGPSEAPSVKGASQSFWSPPPDEPVKVHLAFFGTGFGVVGTF